MTTRPTAVRRPRSTIVVFADDAAASDQPARTLHASLVRVGVQATYLGRVGDARRIAEVIVEEAADAVEVCLTRDISGVRLIRELLHELIRAGRRDVSIVVHRPTH